MKKYPLTLLLWAVALPLLSQSYTTSLGLRMGTDWGLSLNQRVLKRTTVEGIAQSSLQREEFLLTGVVRQHWPVLSRRMNIYAGGGLHKGWLPDNEELGVTDPFGITLVGGAEVTLARLNISYDLKPAINIIGGEKNFYAQTGVSIRYVLLKANAFNRTDKQKARAKKKRQRARERKKRQRERQKEGRSGFNWKFWEAWGKGGTGGS